VGQPLDHDCHFSPCRPFIALESKRARRIRLALERSPPLEAARFTYPTRFGLDVQRGAPREADASAILVDFQYFDEHFVAQLQKSSTLLMPFGVDFADVEQAVNAGRIVTNAPKDSIRTTSPR
jgi:phosphoglycerate dehydrogenase-like enzyme